MYIQYFIFLEDDLLKTVFHFCPSKELNYQLVFYPKYI